MSAPPGFSPPKHKAAVWVPDAPALYLTVDKSLTSVQLVPSQVSVLPTLAVVMPA
jgi:hypothetical protein